MKLTEVIKKIIKEEIDYKDRLVKIFKLDYPNFVNKLGSMIADPKFVAFIRNSDFNKFKVTRSNFPVTRLVPTQNEIDAKKSIMLPITSAEQFKKVNENLDSVELGGPIIIFNGKYIIDGHHRWSQAFVVSDKAKISAYNFTNPDVKSPLDALKLIQVAIVKSGANEIPSASVQGSNLLQMSAKMVVEFVKSNATDAVTKYANSIGIENLPLYIAKNVVKMQRTSQPIGSAPSRDIMPQTGEVPGGISSTIKSLKVGLPLPENKKV